MHYGIILQNDISIGTKAFNGELSLRKGTGGIIRLAHCRPIAKITDSNGTPYWPSVVRTIGQ